MEVLVIHTTFQPFYNEVSRLKECSESSSLYDKLINYYTSVRDSQTEFFIIVDLYFNNTRKKMVRGFSYKNSIFTLFDVEDEIKDFILNNVHFTYVNSMYSYQCNLFNYKPLTYRLDNNEEIFKIKKSLLSMKFQKKNPSALHDILVEKIFDRDNIIHFCSTRCDLSSYDDEQLDLIYRNTLERIGFIRRPGDNFVENTLAGDIGEYLSALFLKEYFETVEKTSYVLPRLAFKTNCDLPLHGVDGCLYFPDDEKIFYIESKFYKKFTKAVNDAISSLNGQILSSQSMSKSISVESLRNISNQMKIDQRVIEIKEGAEQIFVLFLPQESQFEFDKIVSYLISNENLKTFKANFIVKVVVLPVFDKEKFMKAFYKRSIEISKGAYL